MGLFYRPVPAARMRGWTTVPGTLIGIGAYIALAVLILLWRDLARRR
jgi:hypothetical protein